MHLVYGLFIPFEPLDSLLYNVDLLLDELLVLLINLVSEGVYEEFFAAVALTLSQSLVVLPLLD